MSRHCSKRDRESFLALVASVVENVSLYTRHFFLGKSLFVRIPVQRETASCFFAYWFCFVPVNSLKVQCSAYAKGVMLFT